MKKGQLRLAFCASLLTLSSGCGPPSVWSGSWRLDQSRSSEPGPTFTLSILASGEYRYAIESSGYNFRCDGKDYPATPTYTLSCVQKGATALESVTKRNGTTLATADWELSADNKTLTIKSTATDPKETGKSSENVYDRLTGTTGFAGDWRNPKALESRPQILYLSRRWQSMHFAYPQARQYTDAPLDGSDAIIHGPLMSEEFTMSLKPNGPQEFLQTYKHNGQIFRQGTLRIGGDWKTVFNESWRPESPNQKTVLVFQKQ